MGAEFRKTTLVAAPHKQMQEGLSPGNATEKRSKCQASAIMSK